MVRQGFKYFMQLKHYVQWTLFISVLMFLLPVNKKLTTTQRGSGSISVFFSWSILIQFLRIVPLVGVYILAVQKVFWTFMKVKKWLLSHYKAAGVVSEQRDYCRTFSFFFSP